MKTFKVGEVIKFRVRIDGDPTSDNPTAIVLDETDTTEATLTLGTGLTQVGSTKIVKGEFTPDAAGMWSVHITDDTGMDLVKQYPVGNFSIESIGAVANTVEAKVDSIIASLGGGGGHFG